MEILKQDLNSPLPVEEQVAIVYCGTKGLLKNVPINKVKQFEKDYLGYLKTKHADTLDALKNGKYSDAETSVLEAAAIEMTAQYT